MMMGDKKVAEKTSGYLKNGGTWSSNRGALGYLVQLFCSNLHLWIQLKGFGYFILN